jgi:hypothetical protein
MNTLIGICYDFKQKYILKMVDEDMVFPSVTEITFLFLRERKRCDRWLDRLWMGGHWVGRGRCSD